LLTHSNLLIFFSYIIEYIILKSAWFSWLIKYDIKLRKSFPPFLRPTPPSTWSLYLLHHSKPIRRFLWCGMRDKKKGGLGIGSLMSKNRALLFKLIWRLSSPSSALWKSLIINLYRPDFDMETFFFELCSMWKELLNFLLILRCTQYWGIYASPQPMCSFSKVSFQCNVWWLISKLLSSPWFMNVIIA